ncbi:MAG: aspartate-semialdehyde dehydrogenase [Bacteroidota bacterium]|nr:aspartate-semialdehyde dehydrogenase [Bacteroidota bacterium]
MTLYNVVVVGATGLVGRKIRDILEERNFPVDRLVPVASRKSVGLDILFKGLHVKVAPLDENAFVHADIAFFATKNDISREWVPRAAQHCRIVIDNSSAFRQERGIPLVIPEINPRTIFTSRSRIVANPNCSTIQMLLPLKPLDDAYRIRRIVVATYQAVSGAGQRGVLQLEHETAGKSVPEHNRVFRHPIAGNVLPEVGVLYSDGFSSEEYKMVDETRKILGRCSIKVAPTCVRVPVMNVHSEAVTVEFERPFDMRTVQRILQEAPGVVLANGENGSGYPHALEVDGRDEVFVGRLRRDESVSNGLSMWIVMDNLRKGAATNAVQIAEAWVKGPSAFKVETP